MIKCRKKNPVFRIEKDSQSRKASIEQTFFAMKKGEENIYQAALKKDIIFGYADLLVKKQGDSPLGGHYYIPYDFKLSRHPKPSALIQLCCYCDILQTVQGLLPPQFAVVTKDEKTHFFKTSCFFHFYLFLKKRFLLYHESFSEKHIPLPEKQAEHRDWSFFAEKTRQRAEDISLVAGIRSTHSVLLKRKGLNKLTDLTLYKDKKPVKGIPALTFRALKEQAEIQLNSRGKKKPLYKLIPHTGKKKGLEMLPPPHPADLFLCMEGHPILGMEGMEYLYGTILQERYIPVWALSEEEEKSAFQNYLNKLHKHFHKYHGSHIYHYGHYELAAIKKLMGKYGTKEKEVDTLLRHQTFVNLQRILKQSLRVGVFSYSLKEVEKLYDTKKDSTNDPRFREGEEGLTHNTFTEKSKDPTASHCIKTKSQAALCFFHFLNSQNKPLQNKDPAKKTSASENSPFLQKIKAYNQKNCSSVKKLRRFLLNIQKENKIQYIPLKKDKEQTPTGGLKAECFSKAEELLKQALPAKINFTQNISHIKKEDEVSYTCSILAELLKFHIREDKPGWWDYFSHLEMNAEEMLEDGQVITDCRVTESARDNHKIQFEREQEISLKENDLVTLLENRDNVWDSYKILSLDLIEGSLWLKSQTAGAKLPHNKTFTLTIKKNDFYKNNLLKSLLKTAGDFSRASPFMGLKKCLYDLLLKKAPDLIGYKGPLISDKKQIVEEISSLLLKLNHSVFCIQGPPGAGKTYTSARIILNLIKAGKKVGVTAHSHKAILNMLKMIFQQNKEGLSFTCQKVKDSQNKEEEQNFFQNLPVDLVEGAGAVKNAEVTAGTVFFFSRAEQENTYDYLFVDEASQLSLANMISAGRATNNIILIGDQNQLDQPVQAVHPGESGLSALTYYTGGEVTISKEKGVFLPLSYRMHPAICRVVSDCFYEGKLKSHSSTNGQKILFPLRQESAGFRLPETGICFIPVSHSGNSHSSKEEAKLISDIYKTLLTAKWINQKGKTSPLTTEDILIVAPYNVQVACLKRELSYIQNPRIASVDKFQGQEAPVCIVSLTASTLQDAPRGISFLLNKNRLNVALSRARCLSLIIGSPDLADSHVFSIPNMELMNIYCRFSSNC